MILRAVFFIGLVALLMPHEPDLGLGRPAGIAPAAPAGIVDWAKANVAPNVQDPQNLCRYNGAACATTISLLSEFRDATARGLSAVKADIEESKHPRLQHIGG